MKTTYKAGQNEREHLTDDIINCTMSRMACTPVLDQCTGKVCRWTQAVKKLSLFINGNLEKKWELKLIHEYVSRSASSPYSKLSISL